MVGRAGDSLAALQNPFLHPPVPGRVAQGQLQIEVPSHHKSPQLQVQLPTSLASAASLVYSLSVSDVAFELFAYETVKATALPTPVPIAHAACIISNSCCNVAVRLLWQVHTCA